MTVTPPSPATAVTSTSPVLMPIEKVRLPVRSCMARAAAMARSASSSWADGTPNTAIRQSPMYLSTVPPWSATTVAMRRKAASTLPATASGSACSAMVVNPTTSANSTVASLRSSAGRMAATGAGRSPVRVVPQ